MMLSGMLHCVCERLIFNIGVFMGGANNPKCLFLTGFVYILCFTYGAVLK